jgi:hypothetical protein
MATHRAELENLGWKTPLTRRSHLLIPLLFGKIFGPSVS